MVAVYCLISTGKVRRTMVDKRVRYTIQQMALADNEMADRLVDYLRRETLEFHIRAIRCELSRINRSDKPITLIFRNGDRKPAILSCDTIGNYHVSSSREHFTIRLLPSHIVAIAGRHVYVNID